MGSTDQPPGGDQGVEQPALPAVPPVGLDRFSLAVALGAIGLVVLAVALVLGQGRDARPMDESRPIGVVHNYFLALERDDPRTAYEYLSTKARVRPPYDQFATRRSRSGRQPRIRIEDERVEGDSARVTVRRSFGPVGFFPIGSEDGGGYTQTINLQREDGAWKITVVPG